MGLIKVIIMCGVVALVIWTLVSISKCESEARRQREEAVSENCLSIMTRGVDRTGQPPHPDYLEFCQSLVPY